MSEPIPESIPTSMDPRSHRPAKKKRALSPTSLQASQLSTLFAHPERPVPLPPSTSSTSTSTLHAPPEIVANVQGSSAGAGSGEFHVYKASRRREYERVRAMEEEVRAERERELFEREREERERRDGEKTKRNRERRERKRGKGGKGEEQKGERSGGGGERGVKGPRVDGKDEETGEQVGENEVREVADAVPEAGLIIHDDD